MDIRCCHLYGTRCKTIDEFKNSTIEEVGCVYWIISINYRSNVDIMTNQRIIFLFVGLIIIALISAIGAQYWDMRHLTDSWYLALGNFLIC